MATRLSRGKGVYGIEQNADINVTPFVDVMLVLLIIFMVSIPVATSAIRLDMPPADGRSGGKPVYISVMGPDALYIGDRKTSFATLDADLRAALQSPDPLAQRVLIRGDKDVQYADFMHVLNALQQDGYLKIGLINEDLT